jgi:hypothetical protein
LEDLLDVQSEKPFIKQWNLCPKKFEKSCQWGLCDPLVVILWKGTDSSGNALTSHYESFMSFTQYNKKNIYNDLSQISYDEEYMKFITTHLDIPKDIFLRLTTYAREKAKNTNKSKHKHKRKH